MKQNLSTCSQRKKKEAKKKEIPTTTIRNFNDKKNIEEEASTLRLSYRSLVACSNEEDRVNN